VDSFTARKGVEWTTVKMRLLLLFVPLLFAMLLMSACSPCTSQSKVATPPPTAKQYYLVLPPDEVEYLFRMHIFSLIPDEYASWVGDIYRSYTAKDIGRGDWLIYASHRGTSGTWKLTQESPFEFTFLRWDEGAKFIEDSVLNLLWDRPNLSDLSVLGREARYVRIRQYIDAYRAVLKAVTAEANGDRNADWLRGQADGLSEGKVLRYEVRVVE